MENEPLELVLCLASHSDVNEYFQYKENDEQKKTHSCEASSPLSHICFIIDTYSILDPDVIFLVLTSLWERISEGGSTLLL